MEIRKLDDEDAEAYWRLRLEGLESEPSGFGTSAAEHRRVTTEQILDRWRSMPGGSFLLGAFHGDALVAVLTLMREAGAKEQHKGHFYGVYVNPAFRRQGVGEALLTQAVAMAKADPSLEQILLSVATTGTAACALYSKLGFKVYGTEPRSLKIGTDYFDEHQMILMLR